MTAPADNDPMDASSLQSALPATAPAPDASSAPLFGTSNDHLLWNGLSYLNQELARRLARQRGEILVHATQSSAKGNRRGSYEWQQDVFCNILVRKVEVVASILASVDPKPVATSDPNDFAYIAQPKILIAANPRKEDHDKRKGAFVSDNKVVVAYPGYHTKWTATSLPPFLLKEYVDECLGFAKREVLNKLQELQRMIDADRESSADSASPGSITYSADQDLSKYEMHEGEEDHDVPVTDSKDSRKRGADAPEPGSESPTKMNRKKDDDGDIDIQDS